MWITHHLKNKKKEGFAEPMRHWDRNSSGFQRWFDFVKISGSGRFVKFSRFDVFFFKVLPCILVCGCLFFWKLEITKSADQSFSLDLFGALRAFFQFAPGLAEDRHYNKWDDRYRGCKSPPCYWGPDICIPGHCWPDIAAANGRTAFEPFPKQQPDRLFFF